MKLFWDQDRGGRNFGDAFTAVLLRRQGVAVEWSPADEAELVGVGSLAEALPPGFSGYLFGTGKMFGGTQLDLRAAKVLALRGVLTAEGSRADCSLLADPVLLAPDWVSECERDVPLGTIRHYVDRRQIPRDAHVIDVLAGVEVVIAQAARCQRIVASSLHGLVLADALGIENLWDPHPGVLGEGFKFRDYGSSYGELIRPGVWRLADQAQVAAKREALRAALVRLT